MTDFLGRGKRVINVTAEILRGLQSTIAVSIPTSDRRAARKFFRSIASFTSRLVASNSD